MVKEDNPFLQGMCLWTVKVCFCTTRVLCKAASLVATHLQSVWQMAITVRTEVSELMEFSAS